MSDHMRITPHYLNKTTPSPGGGEARSASTGPAFQDFLEGARRVGQGAGSLLTALVPQLAGVAGLGLGPLGSSGAALAGAGGMGTDFQAQWALLQEQKRIQFEGQVINMHTNILKAEHEARMSVIRSIRP